MSDNTDSENVTVEKALQLIDEAIRPFIETEQIPVKSAAGRILAGEVAAQRDIPKNDNSAMDGFLFLAKNLNDGQREFVISGEIRAEDDNVTSPETGFSKRIMTGAPVPDGHFIVVPVELADVKDDTVVVRELPKRNPIRRKGEGYQKGRTVLEDNQEIRPYEMGLMIESGNPFCSVKKPLKVAIQVTGSEIDEDMNTNGPVLEGLLNRWSGVVVSQQPVLEDSPEAVLRRMKDLQSSYDVVITTGGISMGTHDYILESMEKLGAEVVLRKIQQKPGKPFTISKLGETPYFHLPGNPVSAIFCAEMYVRRAIRRQLGLPVEALRASTKTPLSNHRSEKTLFSCGKLYLDENSRVCVDCSGDMKSHLLQIYNNCNVYVRLNPGSDYQAGELLEVIPFSTTNLL